MFLSWPKGEEIRDYARIDDGHMKAQAAAHQQTAQSCFEVPTFFGTFGLGASAFGTTSVFHPGFDDFELFDRADYYQIASSSWGKRMAIEAGIELMGYFVGEVREFNVPVDLSYLTSFQQEVLHAVRQVPFGDTITVCELASRSGHHRKFAPVTNVLRHNPVPVIVPCHRIVPTNGGVGDWSGPIGFKQQLLELEGHTLIEQPVFA